MRPPFQTATPLQWRISAGFRPKSNRYTWPRVADRKCQKLAVFRQCSGVAVSNPPLRRKGGVLEAVAVQPCGPGGRISVRKWSWCRWLVRRDEWPIMSQQSRAHAREAGDTGILRVYPEGGG